MSRSNSNFGHGWRAGVSAGLAITFAALAVATPANAAKGDFTVQNPTTAPISAGQSAWLSTTFVGGPCALSAFALTVSGLPKDYSVSYPTAPRSGTDTSLYRDDVLGADELDFASFYFTAPDDADAGSVSITADISYTLDDGCIKDGVDNGKIKEGKEKVSLTVPINESARRS